MTNDRARSGSPRADRDTRREPRRDARRRSRSSQREETKSGNSRRRQQASGFKWKDSGHKDRRADGDTSHDNNRALERGYRNRSSSPKRRDLDHTRNSKHESSSRYAVDDKYNTADKFGLSSSTRAKPEAHTKGAGDTEENDKRLQSPTRPSPATKVTATTMTNVGEPMIIVHINDRLGTRAAIPCLASDPIHLFKAQVAARIGRKPHEIMLKRQGERPFKDQLSLEDYGISNGVQIDLEIDTGD